MDWLTSHRPVKSYEYYRHKLLSFLYSAEGKEDLRCLNIPFAQLGFYSPMHFISCIPLEMCEPFKNDKLFLATCGEIRRGDKVFLQEKGTDEGVIRSAVFKGKKMGENNEPEIILDGHRQTYSADEIVPYKEYLRQHVGTSLVPESSYVMPGGMIEWDEPTWEVGQEVYYKPEKRWATILNTEENARGRILATIQMDRTQGKKDKVVRVPLNDLMAESVPLRNPKQISDQIIVSSIQNPNELTVKDGMHGTYIPEPLPEPPALTHNGNGMGAQEMIDRNSLSDGMSSGSVPNYSSSGSSVTYQTDKDGPTFYEVTPKKPSSGLYSTITKSILRKKPSKKSARPASEYFPNSNSGISMANGSENIYQEPNQVKFKSCNNLNSPITDDDLDQLELVSYTNSLRSSARKIIQKQMAQQDSQRSLNLRSSTRNSSNPRPHVAEIFAWKNDAEPAPTTPTSHHPPDLRQEQTTLDEPPVPVVRTKRSTPSKVEHKRGNMPSIAMAYLAAVQNSAENKRMAKTERSTPVQMMSAPPPPPQEEYKRPPQDEYKRTPQVQHNHPPQQEYSRTPQQEYNRTPQQEYKRTPQQEYQNTPQQEFKRPPSEEHKHQNPLDYNFLPLSSSDLVKQQLAAANRVLKNSTNPSVTKQNYVVMNQTHTTHTYNKHVREASSDSSCHDNDSGRGSYDVTKRINTSNSSTPVIPTTVDSPASSPHSSDSAINPLSASPKKYVKNRSSPTKHLQKPVNTNGNSDYMEEECTVPHPLVHGNLNDITGSAKGIHGTLTSSFADATLYALFTCSNVFDRELLFSKPGQIERGIKRDVRKILREKIVTPLRQDGYCKAENITHLRESMLPLSSKMHSAFMDAEEFLYLLFDNALNTENFLEFSNGTKDFMHQIVARPKDRSKSQTVQFMLETSLAASELKFQSVPQPALFLCMPRCKGRLVYYEAIIPSLQLNITKLLNQGPKHCVCEKAATLECIICHQKNGEIALDFCGACKGIADQVHFRLDHSPVLVPKPHKSFVLNLQSIICTRGNNYVAFVKTSEKRIAPWLFFDPMAGEFPEVTLLEDFGRWLDSLEKQPGHYREFAKLHPLLKRIMTDSHIYVYTKTHIVDDPGCNESLVI